MKWPEGRAESKFLRKVPETMVDDLEAIAKVIPSVQKKDTNDMKVLLITTLTLKNDLAKSIFEKLSGLKFIKVQGPNSR